MGSQAARLARTQTWEISPAVLLELEILHEIGRIGLGVDQIMASAAEVGDLTISQTPYLNVVQASRKLSWTRDPIDRLIVAHAMNEGARLLTADEKILAHFKDAVWD